MVRGGEGLAKAVNFYQTIGLHAVRVTDEWAELVCSNTKLNLQVVQNEAQLSVGYSPHLVFEIENLDTTIAHCVMAGGHLDGPIQFPAHGKVAVLRSPDGHMIGLYEPNNK
jgi:predicted enzyme related to lactoylglutathione lyase